MQTLLLMSLPQQDVSLSKKEKKRKRDLLAIRLRMHLVSVDIRSIMKSITELVPTERESLRRSTLNSESNDIAVTDTVV